MRRGYEKRWDETARDGDQGELFARWAANGLRSGASVEVKTDNASWRTGRVYIEFECKVCGQWVPSGIDRRHTQAELWAHVIVGPIVLFAPTEYVRWAAKHGDVIELPKARSAHPTRGYVMPIADFIEALIGIPASRANDNGRPFPLLARDDPQAPLGRDARGIPVAPYGYTKDRRVRLNPGGKRAGEPITLEMAPLWGDPGMTRDDGYDPQWELTVTQQDGDLAAELYRGGMSIREIAAATGRSYGSIQREIAQHRLTALPSRDIKVCEGSCYQRTFTLGWVHGQDKRTTPERRGHQAGPSAPVHDSGRGRGTVRRARREVRPLRPLAHRERIRQAPVPQGRPRARRSARHGHGRTVRGRGRRGGAGRQGRGVTSRAECLAEARQQQADAWPAYIARLRELGPGPMAREVYSPSRHEGGIEALEARLAGLIGTGRAAA